MNPLILLLLFGGAAAVMGRRSPKRAAGRRSPIRGARCRKEGSGWWFEIGDLGIHLPASIRGIVSGDDWHTNCLHVAAAPRAYIEAEWSEDPAGDFSRTRAILDLLKQAAGDFPDVHFDFIINAYSAPLREELGLGSSDAVHVTAWVGGYSFALPFDKPSELRPASAAIRESIELRDLREIPDLYTIIQFLVPQLKTMTELYHPNGNQIFWIDPGNREPTEPDPGFLALTCEEFDVGVLLGEDFLPPFEKTDSAIEAPGLMAALGIQGNTAWGFVDWMISHDPGVQMSLNQGNAAQAADRIALQVLRQSNSPCDFGRPIETWPLEVGDFFQWLRSSIGHWIEINEGIPFNP